MLNKCDITPSTCDKDYIWLDINNVIQSKRQHYTHVLHDAVRKVRSTLPVNDKIRIPDQSDNLQLRILNTAHCGSGGLCRAEWIALIVHERYGWSTIIDDAHYFESSCIPWILKKSGKKISWQTALILQVSKPNEVIHFISTIWAPDQINFCA